MSPSRQIFVSYRRDDSAAHAGYLAQTLEALGAGDVFLDVQEMRLGEDFVKRIHYEVGRCDVLIVVIGPRWLGGPDEQGRSRLWDPLDWVHVEVKAALERDVPVVPLLVGGARMPSPELLPEPLRPLAYRHGTAVRESSWQADVAALVAGLPGRPPHDVERTPPAAAAGAQQAPAQGVSGWTATSAAALHERLSQAGHLVQAGTIAAAAHRGGFCDRGTVYRLGAYSPDRSLKGFTRPVATAMAQLQAEGTLAADAVSPMVPVFGDVEGSQRASGFRMPDALVPVFAPILPRPSFLDARVEEVPGRLAQAEPEGERALSLEDHLQRLQPSPQVAALARTLAESRPLVTAHHGYVSLSPPDGRGIAVYLHRQRLSIALPPERAPAAAAQLAGSELQRKSPATTYLVLGLDVLAASFSEVVSLAQEALDWRSR